MALAGSLPGPEPLVLPQDTGEIVQVQLKQTLGYFQQRIAAAEETCRRQWQLDFTSAEAYGRSLAAHRARCRAMLGIEAVGSLTGPPQVETVAKGKGCRIERVALPLAIGISSRGLLILPESPGRHPVMILCPDADTWPERFAGLAEGTPPPPWLGRLVARGTAIYVPQSIERLADHPYCALTRGKDRRMVLYRLGYPVGRTMPGLDVQDTLAAIDYLGHRPDVDPGGIGLAGIGQGGMTALYAAASDPRVRAAVVADYFDQRDHCWQEPVDRRLPGQLLVCGDAELAALVAPRSLCIVTSKDSAIPAERKAGEVRRALSFYENLKIPGGLTSVADVPPLELAERAAAILAERLGLPSQGGEVVCPARCVPARQTEAWRNEHFEERIRYLRRLIAASEAKREARWALSARPPAEFPKIKLEMLAEYRRLVGEVPGDGRPLRPRSQLVLSTKKYRAYRVLLDVTDGVEVYGNLLVPEGLQGRAAAVVCQHGLSGTPEMITGLGQKADTPYHEFGRRLAERGYVVFAPLILHYHPVAWTNEQVRMADAAGMMRVAMAVAQTRRAVDFLAGLPFVDPKRIGYYGLSYGGYSAIWISPLEERLAAVVVSGHFNDWRSKITADSTPTSYLLHPDEDFYNWDVLNRFTHVEILTMVAPRAVCIEYGTRDGITTPEWTAYAWKQLAGIRDHLGLADRIVLAQFDGVHEVRCEGSFAFLDQHLRAGR
jgi:dienelactone hydrolase